MQPPEEHHHHHEEQNFGNNDLDHASKKDLMEEKLRNMNHLSTITENQDSPYSTRGRKNSNSKSHIKADKIFTPSIPNGSQNLLANTEDRPPESDNYYPISDVSSNRPTSPRFAVEEVSNYEPILISKGQTLPLETDEVKSKTNLTPLMRQRSASSPSRSEAMKSDTGMSPMQVKKQNKQDPLNPLLPKRQPVMAIKKISNSDPSRNDVKLPDIVVTPGSDSEAYGDSGGSQDNKKADAISAFDNATFYV